MDSETKIRLGAQPGDLLAAVSQAAMVPDSMPALRGPSWPLCKVNVAAEQRKPSASLGWRPSEVLAPGPEAKHYLARRD